MTDNVREALDVLREMYGQAITTYVERVVRTESRSCVFSPEEIVSLAYIVLERSAKLYDSAQGEFKNYAIRAIRNELLRQHNKNEFLFTDLTSADGTKLYKETENDEPYIYQETSKDTVTETYYTREREKQYVLLAAVISETLTSFEKILVYLHFYSEKTNRPTVMHDIAVSVLDIPYQELLTMLKGAVTKLRDAL